MATSLGYSAAAQGDLASIYDWIADEADPHVADSYVSRIQDACEALLDFPGRGSPRDELAPGLRSVAFERAATIYYRLAEEQVEIVRILHSGRDAGRAFDAA